ncbi:hypothetical protein GCM10009804_70990 [Kribbella hippodromi]|uniref:DUF6545 domain-containing protein n=1 Tax=Kribbella hippodromi TaxID=434347 RepID=A0ABP4Q9R0_9ACTN
MAGVGAFGLLTYRLIRSGYPGVRYSWCLNACLALGMALTTPDAVDLFDHSRSVPMLTTLASDGLKILGLGFLILFLGTLRGTTRHRRAVIVLTLATIATETILFLLAAPHPVGEDLVVAPGRVGAFAAYLTVFVAYGLAGLLIFTISIGAVVRSATGPLRVGLVLITAGSITGLCWVAWTISDLAALLRNGRIVLAEDATSAVLGATAIGLAAIGATVGLWHSTLARLIRAHRARREYTRLEPLWALVSSAAPDVVLDPGVSVRYRNAEFALYRRVIEIRDGYLALRDHLPSAPNPTPAGEANLLVAATNARRTGQPPTHTTAPTSQPEPPAEGEPLAVEVIWLGQVADAVRLVGVPSQ